MSSAAARQRARRSRQKQGQIPLTVIVDEVPWVIALLDGGFLAPAEQEDRHAISRALSQVLDLLLRADLADLVSRRDNS
jgi:hypothetical protein